MSLNVVDLRFSMKNIALDQCARAIGLRRTTICRVITSIHKLHIAQFIKTDNLRSFEIIIIYVYNE